MIRSLIAALWSVALLAMGAMIGMLGSVHGPDRFVYFGFAYGIAAAAAVWLAYWFVGKRGYRHPAVLLFACGLVLAAALVGASQLTISKLVDWEVAEQEKRAAATQVFDVHDEPLLSAKGNPIGIRLRYSIRFPNSDYFWHTPMLRAEQSGVTFWADGRLAQPVIDPPMYPGKYGALRYVQGKQYTIRLDVLPNFLMQDPARKKLCIVQPPPEYRDSFAKLIADGRAMHYKVSVNGTRYDQPTENTYSPKVFYDSAVKEGAVELSGLGLGGVMQKCE